MTTREPFMFESLPVSALEKVMPNAARPGRRHAAGSMLKNERFHFQVAIKAIPSDKCIVQVHVDADPCIANSIKLFEVKNMPSELTRIPTNDPRDTNFLGEKAGVFPDLLAPIHPVGLSITSGQWRSVWVSVCAEDGAELPAGIHTIRVRFTENGTDVAASAFTLTVIDAELPEQQLIYTAWFYLDTLMVHYGVEAFSDEHWQVVENYLRMAASRGMNMVLTPCFTPPLDTGVGHERPTIQLVDVSVSGGEYSFGFERLSRFIALSKRCGIKYFEIAHLFTQWGAKHAPKIIATVDGEQKKIFGWETDACGAEYAQFLRAYLPQLIAFLQSEGVADHCYFHVSDEPSMQHLDSYKSASELLSSLIGNMKTFDALSDYAFYEQGLVKVPIPATHSLDEFYEHGVKPLWCYYCAFGSDFLTMRYFATPSARNRIFGYQLYKYDIHGYLHWGYNFYFSQYSLYTVDPFLATDSGGWCPSGDNYLVYPGADFMPLSSIRNEVFFDALQDLRALRALEQKIGRERVLNMLDEDLFKPLSMYDYPKDDEWILNMRERINAMLGQQ